MHFQILVYDSNHMRTVKVLICFVGSKKGFKKTSRTTHAISSIKKQRKTSISGINPVSAHPQVPGKCIAAAMQTAYGTNCGHGIEKKHKETERQMTTTQIIYIL